MDINLFNDINYLEPHCPKCGTILKYGTNTEFDSKAKDHKCLNCGEILK